MQMASQDLLDKMYQLILRNMMETGHAPHYTDMAGRLRIPVEESRGVLHELVDKGIPGIWLFPDTDYISSFAPLSSLPTQYRITVEGKQKWFGQ
jgi:hypothetical protein